MISSLLAAVNAFLHQPLVLPLYVVAVLEIAIVVITIIQAKRDRTYDPQRLPEFIGKYLPGWLVLVVLAIATAALLPAAGTTDIDPLVAPIGVAYAGSVLAIIRRDADRLAALAQGQPNLDIPIDSTVPPGS